MTEHTIELDAHRGMAAQKATELRRLVSEVAADRAKLKTRQDELEKQLVAAPATDWPDVAEKARYLISIFATTLEAQDPRRKRLIANLLDDLERLLAPLSNDHAGADAPPTKRIRLWPRPRGLWGWTMAKGQKCSNREPKKLKGAEKKEKKDAGPKYLRQAEVLQTGRLRGKPLGQKP